MLDGRAKMVFCANNKTEKKFSVFKCKYIAVRLCWSNNFIQELTHSNKILAVNTNWYDQWNALRKWMFEYFIERKNRILNVFLK